ncbi:MAG: PQQ-dependent sugar dehydrogenase [Planctomycetota bacterium]|nr:PQQ-dependent sugar dehydrogenase [Planctomycetota bacterium]
MLKRAIASMALVGLCIAATTQLDNPSKQEDFKNPSMDSQPADFRSGGGEQMSGYRLATGLARPVLVTHDGVNPDWIYVVEQRSGSTGRIKILNRSNGTLVSTFLSVSGLNTGSEQGLLGLAFDPDYENNGYFYVNYTQSSRTYITRYTRSSSNPQVADSGSAEVVLFISQPFTNHNGGWIEFGPDGYLYISNGDGGSGGDPGNRAQDITGQLLGKMLRIDVSSLPYSSPPDNPFVSQTGDDEIWSYGLRNAWRCSFDRDTGDLWMGDVGQNAWEEVDFQLASSPGGENWGWRCYEGDHSYNTSGCPSSGTMDFPIWEYSHGGSPFRCSITGGYVYRGSSMPWLDGTYFFADYCSNQIWSLRYDGSNVSEYTDRTSELTPNAGAIGAISSFGEDYYGELYICDLNGEIFKIVPDEPTGACCFNDVCVPDQTATTCNNVGGVYQGDNVDCDDVNCATPPSNDDCENAIAAEEGPNSYDTENATDSGYTESCTFGADVWFKFDPLYDGTMLVTVSGTVFDPEVGLYDGSCPSANFQAAICGQDSFIYTVSEGTSYWFRIGNNAGATGIGTLSISVIPSKEECPGDCDGDGQRNVNDLLALLADYGNPSDCDITGDGIISVDDILDLLANFNVPCE